MTPITASKEGTGCYIWGLCPGLPPLHVVSRDPGKFGESMSSTEALYVDSDTQY